MTTSNMNSASDYFAHVVKPNKDAFFGAPSTFANALNLATALYHFHEWLFYSFQSELEAEFNATFSSLYKFWEAVQATDTRFGYIRDVTNASKHVSIGGTWEAKAIYQNDAHRQYAHCLHTLWRWGIWKRPLWRIKCHC